MRMKQELMDEKLKDDELRCYIFIILWHINQKMTVFQVNKHVICYLYTSLSHVKFLSLYQQHKSL